MDDKFKLSEKSKQMLKELVDKPMIMMETIDITEFAPFRKLSFAIAESVDNRIMEKVIDESLSFDFKGTGIEIEYRERKEK